MILSVSPAKYITVIAMSRESGTARLTTIVSLRRLKKKKRTKPAMSPPMSPLPSSLVKASSITLPVSKSVNIPTSARRGFSWSSLKV